MGGESLGLGTMGGLNCTAAGGIVGGSGSLRTVGGLTVSAAREMGCRSVGLGAVGGLNVTSDRGMGDGSGSLGTVGGLTVTTAAGIGGRDLGLGTMGGLNVTASRITVDGSMDFGGNTEGVNNAGGMGKGSLGFGGATGGVVKPGTGGISEGLLESCAIMGEAPVTCPGGDEDRCNLSAGKWSAGGEDVMRAWSLDQLYDVAKSKQHFAVLLVRKFFTREQLQGHSVSGGKLGKLPLDKGLLEKVRGIYFVYHPSDTKEEDWKRCVTAINTYLRGKAFRKT